MIYQENNRLVFQYDAEKLWIEPWGPNALRVRATKMAKMQEQDWSLLPGKEAECKIVIKDDGAEIVNGKIKASVSKWGKVIFYNQDGTILMEEYWRNRRDVTDPKCSAIEVEGREFQPNIGGDYHLTMRLESQDRDEKIYGMGQYQQPYLNLKGLIWSLHTEIPRQVYRSLFLQEDMVCYGTILQSDELFLAEIL